MNEIVELIQSLGFPVAVCLACLWYVYKLTQQSREDRINREERMFNQIENITNNLVEITKQLTSLNERIDNIESEVFKHE